MFNISRQTAKTSGLLRYFTGEPCKIGHIAERYVKDCHCVVCDTICAKRRKNNSLRKRRAYLDPQKRQAILVNQKKWYDNQTKEQRSLRREYRRRYDLNRRAIDLKYRITKNIRSRVYMVIQKRYKSGSAIKDLGCDLDSFLEHISKQFQEGMSWDNYGTWHLDHKIPLAAFDLINPTEFKKAVHYTNYQPLWKLDNLRKNAQIISF